MLLLWISKVKVNYSRFQFAFEKSLRMFVCKFRMFVAKFRMFVAKFQCLF